MLMERLFSCLAKPVVSASLLFFPVLLHSSTYVQTNLVSDLTGVAATVDPNLKNPWGLAFSATSPFWASDQAAGLATLYDGAGNAVALVVSVPGSTTPPSGPTGQVFNGTADFALPDGSAAKFIFDTLNGTIAGWNGGTAAVQMVSTPGAEYTGLAIGSAGGSNYLYAANNSGGDIRVFDSSFSDVTSTTFAGKFVDPNAIPGFAPFNVQAIGGNLYVTYAALTPLGTGLPGGYVDVFDMSGNFVKRLATNGALNAPWGVTQAPSGFGSFSNDILVGNFQSGEIGAYDPVSGAFLGYLDEANGMPLVNEFLWALDFRTGGPNVNTDALYFTAGIGNQQDGLFGDIAAATPEPSTLFAPLALGLLGLAVVRRTRRLS